MELSHSFSKLPQRKLKYALCPFHLHCFFLLKAWVWWLELATILDSEDKGLTLETADQWAAESKFSRTSRKQSSFIPGRPTSYSHTRKQCLTCAPIIRVFTACSQSWSQQAHHRDRDCRVSAASKVIQPSGPLKKKKSLGLFIDSLPSTKSLKPSSTGYSITIYCQ